ncbi:MAG: hypothetical protein ACLQHK_14060 [Gallionellaceae bacterium]
MNKHLNIATLFLLLVLCVNLYTLLGIDRDYQPYITGDWLINYQGGFIRRGLIGEIIFQVTPIIGISPWVLVYIIQATLYIGITLLVTKKIWSDVNIAGLLFIISPLTFLFEVYDPGGLGRKELFILFLIGLNGQILETHPEKVGGVIYLWVLAVAGSIAILIHELALFCLPIVLLQLSVYGKCEYRKFAIPAIIWLIVAGAVFINKGEEQPAYSISVSWLPYTKTLYAACQVDFGAICYLKKSTADAIKDTMANGFVKVAAIYWVIIFAYSALFVVAINSVVPATNKKEILINLVLAIMLILPLYLLGVDYGRWTHIFVMGLLLSLPNRALDRTTVLSAHTGLNKIMVVLLVLLSLSWNVFHTRGDIVRGGTIGAGIWGYHPCFLNPPMSTRCP